MAFEPIEEESDHASRMAENGRDRDTSSPMGRRSTASDLDAIEFVDGVRVRPRSRRDVQSTSQPSQPSLSSTGDRQSETSRFSTISKEPLVRDKVESPDEASARPSIQAEYERLSGLADILIASAPRLRHLASNSSFDSERRSLSSFQSRRILTPIAEQRHPGKEGVRLSRYSRPFEPDLDEKDEEKLDNDGQSSGFAPTRPSSAPLGKDTGAVATGAQSEAGYLSGWALQALVVGLCLVTFLISIDRSIITTAIPFITSEFHSTNDIGWYGSAYLLTACAFQPLFGRVFMLYSSKWSYIFSIFVFEVGSLICALAPNSPALIAGRAVTGFGSAGILTGSFVIVSVAVPLRLRPIYTAAVGLMFGVGATIGPLLGGVFTDLVTWRWCFWINLPVGGVTMAVILIGFYPKDHAHKHRSFIDRIWDLDLVGNAILLGACVMLFLALEYTTDGMSWGSATVVGLLVGFAATVVVFCIWQWWKQDGGLLPPAIMTQRTVAAACSMAFWTYGAILMHAYFLPIFFQAIFGQTAIQSGVDMIPYIVSNAVFSLLSGIFVSKVGYFTPPAILGSAIGTVGCGVISMFNPQISQSMWIGFQILASAGFGMSIQQGFTAVQTALPEDEIPVGTAAVVASQSLGGAFFVSIGNTVLQSRLRTLGSENPIPGIDLEAVIAAGATAFRDMVPESALPLLLDEYSAALQTVFQVAIPLAGLAFISCCFLEWRSVKGPEEQVKESKV